jgi:hypothetical protein
MPRISAAARAMARFQPGLTPPRPPAHLSTAAKRLWTEIVRDRPDGYFRPGSFSNLASFVEISTELVRVWRIVRAHRADPEVYDTNLRHICRLTTLQARLCGDLRLDPRASVERHSAQRDAVGVWDDDPLFAGRAWWQAQRKPD